MNKTKWIALFFCLALNVAFAQRERRAFALGGELPVAIGFNYEQITDAYRQDGVYSNKGFMMNHSTRRDRLTVDLLYRLSGRWKMESSLGFSAYKSRLYMGRTTTPVTGDASVDIYSPNLVIAQKVMFDLFQLPGLDLYREIYIPASGFLRFTLSPYIALEYEQFLSKRKRFKGYADLMAAPDLPAYAAEIKTPFGIVSAIGGLSLEALLFEKIGLSYDFGYFHSLLGCTQIDAKYRFYGNEIHAVNVKSEKAGILFAGRLRYYF